jgi:hypothetical protein
MKPKRSNSRRNQTRRSPEGPQAEENPKGAAISGSSPSRRPKELFIQSRASKCEECSPWVTRHGRLYLGKRGDIMQSAKWLPLTQFGMKRRRGLAAAG